MQAKESTAPVQMASSPELLKAPYTEGGSALRHYSLCIFNLRAVTVAQGLVLVTGSTLLLKDRSFIAAGAVSVFGILK